VLRRLTSQALAALDVRKGMMICPLLSDSIGI